CMHALQTPYSC
nr:immunoglobulin light chain junction region [Macaca mulatta]